MIDLTPAPSIPSTSPTDVAPVAPVATEIVTRPEPGLARGTWEAPAWVFWGILAAVVVGATVYALYRLGFLRLGYGKPESSSHVSRGTRRP